MKNILFYILSSLVLFSSCNLSWNLDEKDFSCTETTNFWNKIASFPEGGFYQGVSFSNFEKGFCGLGKNGDYNLSFYAYDPFTKNWSKMSNFIGVGRVNSVSFTIDNVAYVGGGFNENIGVLSDFYAYDMEDNSWAKIAPLPVALQYASAFSIGGNGYVGTGLNTENESTKQFFKYESSTNSWSSITDFEGEPRYAGVGFSDGENGYVGGGISDFYKDIWQYSPITDSWSLVANFPSPTVTNLQQFNICERSFFMLGFPINNELWSWDFDNSWELHSNFPAQSRYTSVGFSVGNLGYLGGGTDGEIVFDDCWEYQF